MKNGSRRSGPRLVAGQLAIFLVAAAIFIPTFGPGAAIAGGAGAKLLFVGRIVLLLGLATWMLRARSLGWSDMGLRRPQWRRFLIALPAGLLMALLFSGLTGRGLALAGLDRPNYAMFAPIRGNFGEYLFWLLPVSVGTAAFGEELLFRGFVLDAVSRLIPGSARQVSAISIVMQAVVFGALHFYQGAGGMITAGVIGLAFGLTWLISGRNLWAGIILHAMFDGFAMTVIYLGVLKP